MVMRVSSQKDSVGTFVCFTNPSCPSDPVPSSDEEFVVFTRADNPKRKAISFESERVLFTAKNHGKVPWDKAERKLEKYFIFAFKDGEATLLNKSDASSAFTLTSTINEAAAEEGNASYAPPQLADFASRRERNATLEENFGSRRRRKNQQKMKMAAVSSDRVMGVNKLESTLETLLTSEQNDTVSKVSGNLKRLLPPFDEQADLPEDAYPSTGYFPPEDRDIVFSTVQPETFLFESQVAKSRFQQTKSKEGKRLAAYLECLVRFYSKVRDFVASAKDACKQMSFGNEKLAESLLSRFMEAQPENLGGGFGKSRLLKDKLLIHLLIVLLALEAYKLKPEVLASMAGDLKMEVGGLAPLLYKAGCKLVTEDERKIYVLKTPLSFPEEKRRPGAKRRKA